MPFIQITAYLPFPLRVGSDPYIVREGELEWRLEFKRIQNNDQRVLGAGSTVDFEVDRNGWAAFSQVTGRCSVARMPEHPVVLFAAALNRLIETYRDLFDCFWIRPLEPDDLYQLSVIADGAANWALASGRFGGFHAPVIGLAQDADERFRLSLELGTWPPLWRTLLLDAEEAFNVGRWEDAVLLCWTSLETGCRSCLPGLAQSARWTFAELDDRLAIRDRHGRSSLSYQEAVRRASALNVISVAAQLAPRQTFDPRSLAESVRPAMDMRNRIVHQGLRLLRRDSEEALTAVTFVLREMNLSAATLPDPIECWERRYGRVGSNFRSAVIDRNLVIALAHPTETGFISSWISVEQLGRELWVRVAQNMPADVAETLVLSDIQARDWLTRRDLAHLRVTPAASNFQIPGLSSQVAVSVEKWFAVAFVLWRMGATNPTVTQSAVFAANRLCAELSSASFVIDRVDVRATTLAAALAAYLTLSEQLAESVQMKELSSCQPAIYQRAVRWARQIRESVDDSTHGTCIALRAVHADLMWLDSVLVECPIEQKVFGSRERTIGGPP